MQSNVFNANGMLENYTKFKNHNIHNIYKYIVSSFNQRLNFDRSFYVFHFCFSLNFFPIFQSLCDFDVSNYKNSVRIIQMGTSSPLENRRKQIFSENSVHSNLIFILRQKYHMCIWNKKQVYIKETKFTKSEVDTIHYLICFFFHQLLFQLSSNFNYV